MTDGIQRVLEIIAMVGPAIDVVECVRLRWRVGVLFPTDGEDLLGRLVSLFGVIVLHRKPARRFGRKTVAHGDQRSGRTEAVPSENVASRDEIIKLVAV